MYVGIMKVTLGLDDIESLKDKRSVIQSALRKVEQKFNVAVAETDYNDDLETAEVGLVTVGNERRFVNSMVSKIEAYLTEVAAAEIIAFEWVIEQY